MDCFDSHDHQSEAYRLINVELKHAIKLIITKNLQFTNKNKKGPDSYSHDF